MILTHRNTDLSDFPGEVWKPMVNYEEIFHISNIGRVKRLQNIWISNRISKKTGKPYKQTIVEVKAFIPNPNNFPQVNHINGDNQDNRVENLEWCTNEYNQFHRYSILGRSAPIVKTNKKRIIKVHMLDTSGNILKTYDSITDAAKENGTTTSNICKVDKGERAKAGGYSWLVDKDSRSKRYRQDQKKILDP